MSKPKSPVTLGGLVAKAKALYDLYCLLVRVSLEVDYGIKKRRWNKKKNQEEESEEQDESERQT